MSEDGLFRSKQEQIEQGKLNAVFVRLHQLQDNLVAGNASSTTTTAPLAAMPLSYNNDAYSNAEAKGKSGKPFFRRQVPCYFNSNEIQCKQIVLVQLQLHLISVFSMICGCLRQRKIITISQSMKRQFKPKPCALKELLKTKC
jgi:hypothetical protein